MAAVAYGFAARADGAPSDKPLWYAGTVSHEGTHEPLEGEHRVTFRVFRTATEGTALCEVAPEKVPFASGRFRVDVSACRDTFASQPDLFVELSVDDAAHPFARTKVGAVPYALEAARSSAASGALAETLARLSCEAKHGAWNPAASTPCAPFLRATAQKVGAQENYRACSAEFGPAYGPCTAFQALAHATFEESLPLRVSFWLTAGGAASEQGNGETLFRTLAGNPDLKCVPQTAGEPESLALFYGWGEGYVDGLQCNTNTTQHSVLCCRRRYAQ
jgi:hypothetical protein